MVEYINKQTFVLTVNDITHQHELEKELYALYSIFNLAKDAIVLVTEDGIVTYANDVFLNRYGYTKEEVIGKNTIMFRSGLHNKEFYQKIHNTVSKGKTWTGLISHKHKNNNIINDHATINGIRTTNNKLMYYSVIKID